MRGRALVLVVLVARSASASPLRDQIAVLACDDEAASQQALAMLEQAPRGVLGLPDETLHQPATEVDAYVIDRLLEVLGELRARAPALAPRVDALVASWNYCGVTAEQHTWDLRVEGQAVERTRQGYLSTTAGRGFLAWGLIPRRARGRPVIAEVPALDRTCNVALGRVMMSGSLAAAHVATDPDGACEPPPAPPPAPLPAPPPPPLAEITQTHLEGMQWLVPRAAPRAAAPAAAVGEIQSGSGLPQLRTAGISASAFVHQALAGKLDSGAQLSWAPGSSLFARLGATWQLASDFSPDPRVRPTWSGGVGYDDWHTGTWSFQLNQWGPVVPTDRWNIVRTAAAELAYKVPLGATLGEHLAFKLAASSKLTWSPAAAASLSFKLPRATFASVGVTQGLTSGSRPTWTYVVGRSTWTPGSLAITLANFGPNLILQPNFVAHTGITASWGWAW